MSLSEPGSPSPAVLPPGLISFIRLLVLSEPDFANAHSKEKLPKGNLKKTDVKDNHPVLKILDEVINQREGMYVGGNVEVCPYFSEVQRVPVNPGALTCLRQDDESLLSSTKSLTKPKRHAVIVRLGEKRILKNVRQTVRMLLAEFGISGVAYQNEKGHMKRDKRSGDDGKEIGNGRKRAVNEILGGCGHKKARK